MTQIGPSEAKKKGTDKHRRRAWKLPAVGVVLLRGGGPRQVFNKAPVNRSSACQAGLCRENGVRRDMLIKNQDSYVHSHVGILTRAKPRAVPESAPAAEKGTIAPGHGRK